MKKLLALLIVLAVPLGAAAARGSGAGSIVVAEVFAAGGNTGSPYANDYVELFNRGSGSVDVDGWTLQYASSVGTTWQATPLAGTLPAGGRYLVQLASSGTNGATLPAADATGTSNLAMTGGKVAVVSSSTALSCGAAAGSCSAVGGVEDLVGWGNATDYEGSGPAPAVSPTTALARAGSACTDADDNAADFATASPNPENSTAATAACSASSGSGGETGSGAVNLDLQPAISVALGKDTLSFGSVAPGTTPAPLSENVTVSSTDSMGYTLSVQRTAFSPRDLPLGIGVDDGALAPVPVAPDTGLTLAATEGPSAAGGDDWATSVGFVSPLPALPSGRYSATITFTVIGG